MLPTAAFLERGECHAQWSGCFSAPTWPNPRVRVPTAFGPRFFPPSARVDAVLLNWLSSHGISITALFVLLMRVPSASS
jgi:hypothetical protein